MTRINSKKYAFKIMFVAKFRCHKKFFNHRAQYKK